MRTLSLFWVGMVAALIAWIAQEVQRKRYEEWPTDKSF